MQNVIAMTDTDARVPFDAGAHLLARHLEGDARAFEELVERHRGLVYGFLIRSGLPSSTADDLFQETFLRVHQAASRYEPTRPFKAWLMTITNNLLRSHYRKAKVRRVLVGWWQGRGRDARPRDPADTRPSPEQQVAGREALAWMETALTKLPDGPRRALLLTKVQGLSVADAAQALAVPEATVKTWTRRGRIALVEARRAQQGGER